MLLFGPRILLGASISTWCTLAQVRDPHHVNPAKGFESCFLEFRRWGAARSDDDDFASVGGIGPWSSTPWIDASRDLAVRKLNVDD